MNLFNCFLIMAILSISVSAMDRGPIIAFSRTSFGKENNAIYIRGGGILEVKSSEDIQSIIDNSREKLVVVKFTSKDCAPCKLVGPLYTELSESEEFDGVLFLEVDVDINPELAVEYKVTGWPTFLFIKNGDVQTEIVGGKLAQATLYDWVKLLMPKE